MVSPRRRLPTFGALLVLLFLGCGFVYLALQTRSALWLLGALAAFGVLAVLWVRTIVAMRTRVRRDREQAERERWQGRGAPSA